MGKNDLIYLGMEIATHYKSVLPLRNIVLFPGITLPLQVGRKQSMMALEHAQARDGHLVALLQRDADVKDPRIVVQGVSRFRVADVVEQDGYLQAAGEEWPDVIDADEKTQSVLLESLKTIAKEILALLPADTNGLSHLVDTIHDLPLLSHVCAGTLDMVLEEKQALLETVGVKARVLRLLDLMQTYKNSLQVRKEIRSKLSQKLGKDQREAILREQLRAIHDELGETQAIKEDYRDKIDTVGMPDDVRKIALDELKRLDAIGSNSPESHVIRNYLDLLCSLPWNKHASETIDLGAARAILEDDHYGLEKIKKRILQHLAVMKLKKNSRGSILLFVGPPGVGKTSLGQSIARALGRKFVRASLGGVRDDAEIRGHRRTYIGAMPGRIIQGIKRAGENNPVFVLDEIDKMSRGFHGDPAGAMLEVLDPEQNATFLDHYLDVPFDLSKVMFIATANSLEPVPGPLLDRMEVIEISGYTTAEKRHIAKRHLLKKQLAEHGLSENEVVISDEALMRLIAHYTREAGVRELERRIAAVCRAVAERVVEGAQALPIRVEPDALDEMIGPERFVHDVVEDVSPAPGVVTGLAWTPQGGEILFIESSLMPGRGKLTLTGQLGEVMKESAQIALSVVRAKLPDLVSQIGLEKKDLHIHVPAGAIPKDGPSAGIAMATAVASLFTGRSVDPKLGMSGEITLRGAVMPVGGIKEKVIGAHRAGIKRVILPKRNERDLREVPDEVKVDLDIAFAETIDDVLKYALGLQVSAGTAVPAAA